MQLNISDWGNSFGLRIPKNIAKMMGIGSGSKVNLELKEGRLIIFPAQESSLSRLAKHLNLKTMMKKVTRKNIHRSSETEDAPVGNEIW